MSDRAEFHPSAGGAAAPDGVDPRDWDDLRRRRESHRRWFRGQQPKAISNVMAQVVQRKGYANLQAASELDGAWRSAVGERFAKHTRVGSVRRGALEVIVANNLLMQELGFEKERLLAVIQASAPDAAVERLRFRVGNIP